PGCGRRRWLQGHHVKHWVDDGPTDLDNLLLTCRPHHKLVHEFGWTVEGGPDGHATFRRPNGQVYEEGPPALRPEVRRHVAAVPLLC
ncbi:MAG TPA: HNH endonuclease signature motif containing protein, partial [Candidatus Dormibacteraeota bacterium]|nr:HNH endonuclease signature motif containing protein [Candidatus Dormibacteraeota bacterium]